VSALQEPNTHEVQTWLALLPSDRCRQPTQEGGPRARHMKLLDTPSGLEMQDPVCTSDDDDDDSDDDNDAASLPLIAASK
jgi:hypothetical protein